VKEKVLNRTVETFLDKQDQLFTLFEYAVELINEVIELKRKTQVAIFIFRLIIFGKILIINENIFRVFSLTIISIHLLSKIYLLHLRFVKIIFRIKKIFSFKHSVNEANMNVQSLDIAKSNGRELLTTAYQLIDNLFLELNCNSKTILSSFDESVNDRNILLYLATIESRVQQLLPNVKINRKGEGGQSYIDDTTISWRIDHKNMNQPLNSLLTNTKGVNYRDSANLHQMDFITPQIPS
jgi:hypothetical protein